MTLMELQDTTILNNLHSVVIQHMTRVIHLDQKDNALLLGSRWGCPRMIVG